MFEFLHMCLEFFKTGLFSVGGGLATLPFLTRMAKDHPDWFNISELADMIAVAESTPGPIGVNMSTYVGYKVLGVLGGVAATLSLVLPSFLVVMFISSVWEKYKNAESVQRVFAALRATAIGLILSAGAGVFVSAVFPGFTEAGLTLESLVDFQGGLNNIKLLLSSLDIKALILFAVMMLATQFEKTKKIHPIIFIFVAAIVGVVFGL